MNNKEAILLLHGIGSRDHKLFNNWGRIPKYLETLGYSVYYGNTDAWGNIENNAKQINKMVEQIHKDNNITTIHLIAHSKGGLDARYYITNYDSRKYITSLTTLSTPHQGSKTATFLLKYFKIILYLISPLLNKFFKLYGDKNPNFITTISDISNKKIKIFNKQNKDNKNIYYQTYGFKMKNAFSDILLFIPYLFVYAIEGANDGVVATSSMEYTNYKGVFTTNINRGISHADVVDSRKRPLIKYRKNSKFDILGIYHEIITNIKAIND